MHHRHLGILTNKKFLKGLIPSYFSEKVYDGGHHWSCHVKGVTLSNELWDEVKFSIIKEFGDNLIEIDTLSSNGVEFIVNLRQDR